MALQGLGLEPRRPRRDALLEPLPAPRGVPRDPVRRLRPAHAQPAAAPERPRLHRHARGRQGRDRRQVAAAAAGSSSRTRPTIEHVFVVEDSYEELLAGADPDDYEDPKLDEDTAAAMCYTSGTTGMPKGVLYSHRSTVLHTLGQALAAPLGLHVTESETLLPGRADVPRERLGLPVHVPDGRGEARLPRAVPRSARRCSTTSSSEGVTITAGVPTIWMGILGMLDEEPDRWDLSKLHSMLVGGSAAPRAMIAGFRQRHGKTVVHGWGMTETSPLATTSDYVGDFRDRGRGDAARRRRDAGAAAPVRGAARDRRRRQGDPLGRRGDGRARGARPVGRRRLLRDARAGRALDGRRLVQDRRHRLVPPARAT